MAAGGATGVSGIPGVLVIVAATADGVFPPDAAERRLFMEKDWWRRGDLEREREVEILFVFSYECRRIKIALVCNHARDHVNNVIARIQRRILKYGYFRNEDCPIFRL